MLRRLDNERMSRAICKRYMIKTKIGGTCGGIKKFGHKSRIYYLLKKYDVMKPRKSITYIDKRGRMIRHGTQGECG